MRSSRWPSGSGFGHAPRMIPIPRSILAVAVLPLTGSACTEKSNTCPQAEGLIGDGVARFSPQDVACDAIPTSMALLEPRLVQGGEVRIASEEGDRERPERTVDIVVVTDSGIFEGSGSGTSTIIISLE